MSHKIYKIFIDGRAGTTGLRLAERLRARPDVELIEIGEAKRKDLEARLERVSGADISLLCLPDDESREIVAAVGEGCRIIDCSTAHRAESGWAYGLPEIERIDKECIRVANPGCHATGFILSVRPLVNTGILDAAAHLCFFSLTGYSGGGKPMIAIYEADDTKREGSLRAPRQYAPGQDHKHLPEMRKYSGLDAAPIFSPIVCDFYSGMLVCVPLYRGALRRSASIGNIREVLAEYYAKSPLVKVRDQGAEFSETNGEGFLSAAAFAGRDDVEIFVTGKNERIEIISRYDNLGKGASGAAIQNMNLMLGLPEETGLVFGN